MILHSMALLSGVCLFLSVFFLLKLCTCIKEERRKKCHMNRLFHLEALVSKEISSENKEK